MSNSQNELGPWADDGWSRSREQSGDEATS